MHNAQNNDVKDCVILCWTCRTECHETLFLHCLPTGGEHANAEHVKIMTDCIQICQAAADYMTRGSIMHAEVCVACADVCEACAESCESLGGEEMKRCADICRRCAQKCRDMGKIKKAA